MPSDDNYDTIMHGEQNKTEKQNKTRQKTQAPAATETERERGG